MIKNPVTWSRTFHGTFGDDCEEIMRAGSDEINIAPRYIYDITSDITK